MSRPLAGLSHVALSRLATALRSGKLLPPYSPLALNNLVPENQRDAVRAALQAWTSEGMSGRHIASALELLAGERDAQQKLADRVQLVWSPPELAPDIARDTVVVVQELFQLAKTSVLVVTYVLDQDSKAKTLFGGLAARMDADPDLDVQFVVNIAGKYGEDVAPATVVHKFARRFRDEVWPGKRLPDVFYDPRALDLAGATRASMHAKVVVVDDRWTLLTSANFTEAAQERNLEAGVRLDEPRLAMRVRLHLQHLIATGKLLRVPL